MTASMAAGTKRRGGDVDVVVASASVLPDDRWARNVRVGRSLDAQWQADAWALYYALGELRYAAKYAANSFGLIRFFVGTRDHPGAPVIPIPDDPAEDGDPEVSPEDAMMRDCLGAIKGADGSFQSIIRMYALQTFLVGEVFLVGLDGLDGERWEVVSTTEMRKNAKRYGVTVNENTDEVEIPDGGALIIRMWTRDPQLRERADSSVRSVIDVGNALVTALAIQTASDRSRLASNGILFVADDADFPTVTSVQDENGVKRPDLWGDMMRVATTAMENPGSAAACLPIVIPVKSEFIEKKKIAEHVTFAREHDGTIQDRIDHLVTRLAQGLDINPEKIRGVSGVSHWGSWEISQDFVTAHTQPMAQNFCEDLTIGYVTPIAEAAKAAKGGNKIDPTRYALGFTTADLIASPNRDEHAKWLHDNYLLAGDATIEALGYSPDQKMDDDEINKVIRIKQAQAASATAGQVSDDPAEEAAKPAPTPAPAPTPVPAPGEEPTAPDGENVDPAVVSGKNPDKGPPPEKPKTPPSSKPPARKGTATTAIDETMVMRSAELAEAYGRIVGMCEMAVERAVERAGGRLRSKIMASGDETLATLARTAENPLLTFTIGEGRLAALKSSPETLLASAWDGITPRLNGITGNPEITRRIVDATDRAARARMFDPTAVPERLIGVAVRAIMDETTSLVTV